MRGTWALACAGAVLIGVGIGAVYRIRKAGPSAAPIVQTTPSGPPASFTLTGKIRPAHIIVVNPDFAGNIDEFDVDVGDEVMEGQELAHIGGAALESQRADAVAAVEKAQARAEAAEKSVSAAQAEALRARSDAQRIRAGFDRLEKVYERQKVLVAAGATPRLTYEKAEREYESGREEWEAVDKAARAAEERVRDTMKELDGAKKILTGRNEELQDAESAEGSGAVLAPADGIVVGRNGEVGQPAGQLAGGLFQIGTDLYDLEVAADASPELLRRLKPGQPALVIIPDLQGTSISADVKEIRDGQAVISFRNPNPAIRPGMVAQVRVQGQ